MLKVEAASLLLSVTRSEDKAAGRRFYCLSIGRSIVKVDVSLLRPVLR
jgi:hypothetical protein